MRAALERRGAVATVVSAGTLAIDGSPATDGALATVGRLGLDLASHRSQSVTPELVGRADLILGMERQHVQHLVTVHDAALQATFTLPELADLVARIEQRRPDESIADWIERVAPGRDAMVAMAAPEIDDPIGRSNRRYRRTAQLIVDATDAVLDSLLPSRT